MNDMKICGWRIHHKERLVYRANSGNPEIRVKFHHYPEYRQRVEMGRAPQDCRLKKKGKNAFFTLQKKFPAKGSVSFEREISVFPEITVVNPADEWGRISEFPEEIRRKYEESSRYWPLKSDTIDVKHEDWFSSDDLSFWVRSAWKYIRGKIRPENQEKRLGAEEAMKKGMGDCDEFTDLFVTLARMRAIPCRRITGFFIAYKNGNVKAERHAWSDVLSPKFGWVTVDVALNNIGAHTLNYVVLKVEEFNPAISDYSVSINHTSKVHHHWEMEEPKIAPIYCE